MPELVADCPRCGAKSHTFKVANLLFTHKSYSWQRAFEAFSICKNCKTSTVFFLRDKDSDVIRKFDVQDLMNLDGSLNSLLEEKGYLSQRNMSAQKSPDYVPENINKVFMEGSQSFSGNCPNAAASMFRLCLDLATKDFLPDGDAEGLNRDVRKKLSFRLDWLFEKNILPNGLQDFAHSVRLDGNDGAHDGTITIEDAESLLDFTYLLLERIYTEPGKLRAAEERREKRKQKSAAND